MIQDRFREDARSSQGQSYEIKCSTEERLSDRNNASKKVTKAFIYAIIFDLKCLKCQIIQKMIETKRKNHILKAVKMDFIALLLTYAMHSTILF